MTTSVNYSMNFVTSQDASSGQEINRQQGLQRLLKESIRLRTFTNWPSISTFRTVEKLAQCGFFFCGSGQMTQCRFCLTIKSDWRLGDSVPVEHERLNPRCPFILGLPVGNIPYDTVTGSDATGENWIWFLNEVIISGMFPHHSSERRERLRRTLTEQRDGE